LRTRVAQAAVAAVALAAASLGLATSAHAGTGDGWSGHKVVDVVPAATTQTDVIGLMPHFTGGGNDIYMWNAAYMVERNSDGHESWVFCIQAAVDGQSDTYTEDPNAGTAGAKAHIGEINRVLKDSTLPAPGALQVTPVDPDLADPSVHVLPKKKSDHIELTAVQLALWHYSDGFDFTTSNTSIVKDYYPASYTGDADDVTIGDVISRYHQLVASADANPIEPANPSVSIEPDAQTAQAGTALTYTVEGKDVDGSIAVSTDDSAVTLHEANSDGTCKTATISTLPADGGRLCVNSDKARTVKITVTGQSAGTSTHSLFAPNSQAIISTAPEKCSASAKGTWTAPSTTPTPTPTETPTTTPTPSPTETPSTTPSSTPSVEVLATKQGNASVSGSLAATGPADVQAQLTLGALAVAVGGILMLLTRRRTTLVPVTVPADPAQDEVTPTARRAVRASVVRRPGWRIARWDSTDDHPPRWLRDVLHRPRFRRRS
jgi:hypothetical protein